MPKPVTMFAGDIYYNKYGYKIEVLEYVDASKVLIKFHDPIEYEKYSAAREIRNGVVNTPYHRSVQGVGYLGEGPHKAYITGKKYSTEYKIWVDMLTRTYTNVKGIAYECARVCEDWHNFQNFAGWCKNQKFFGLVDYELDKDIIVRGNNLYSPEYCTFVPGFINRLVINRSNYRGKFKIGVFLNLNAKKKYTSSISIEGKRVQLGTFYDEREAYLAYKSAKEDHIKTVAQENKDKISEEVYNSLMRWEINEND